PPARAHTPPPPRPPPRPGRLGRAGARDQPRLPLRAHPRPVERAAAHHSRLVLGSLLVAAAAALWGLWPIWVRLGPSGPAVAAVAFLVGSLAGVPFAVAQARGRRRAPPGSGPPALP